MTPLKMLRLVAILLGVFVLAFAFADGCTRQAHADPAPSIVVNGDIPNVEQVVNRLAAQLRDGDDITIVLYETGTGEQATSTLDQYQLDRVIILAVGRDTYVRGNAWVPTVYLQDRLSRVLNVNRSTVDRVTAMIGEIHAYQDTHAKPAPPPPPPTPPAPPAAPEPPFDWSPYMIYIYIGLPILALFLLWLPLELRRRRRVNRLAKDADDQADWGFDQYGIKTGSDL